MAALSGHLLGLCRLSWRPGIHGQLWVEHSRESVNNKPLWSGRAPLDLVVSSGQSLYSLKHGGCRGSAAVQLTGITPKTGSRRGQV